MKYLKWQFVSVAPLLPASKPAASADSGVTPGGQNLEKSYFILDESSSQLSNGFGSSISDNASAIHAIAPNRSASKRRIFFTSRYLSVGCV